MANSSWSIGSTWHYWDPHIHTPNTKLNNNYGDTKSAWEQYISTLETKTPNPIAIGVTDYYSIDNYCTVRHFKASGRLKNVKLIFPNIEFRLKDAVIEESSGEKEAKLKPVNAHLIISPDDPHHVERIKEFLLKITFRYMRTTYCWCERDLIEVGRRIVDDPNYDERAALSKGIEQCRIDFDHLLDTINSDSWAKSNVLIGISGKKDGTGGMTMLAQRARRTTIYANAQIIFSPNPKDRIFFSDNAPSSKRPKEVKPIPCIHGSDAHSASENSNPVKSNLCWIKATPTFEGFRQILFEPIRRIRIANSPPSAPNNRDTISSVRICSPSWISNDHLSLNPGLVSIIGPKGSGKTALADLIAVAGHEFEHTVSDQSFIARAGKGKHLRGLTVELSWADQSSTVYSHDKPTKLNTRPRIVYLPQHFVERLCSPDGHHDLSLLIEKLVFNSIPTAEQMNQSSFRDLILQLNYGTAPALQNAASNIKNINLKHYSTISHHLKLPSLEAELVEAQQRLIALQEQEKSIAPTKGQDLSTQLSAVTDEIEAIEREVGRLRELSNNIKILRDQLQSIYRQANQSIKQLQAIHSDHTIPLTLLDEHDWVSFLITEPSSVARRLTAIEAKVANDIESEDRTKPSADSLAERRRSLLNKKSQLLKDLGKEQAHTTHQRDISRNIEQIRLQIKKLQTETESAVSAKQDAEHLNQLRLLEYQNIFERLEQQERTYQKLSSYLKDSLPNESKLSLRARRSVNLGAWVEAGERIIDGRSSPFRGRATLVDVAKEHLLDAWQRGSPQEISSKLKKFIHKYFEPTTISLSKGRTEPELYNWLFSTDHISVQYELLWDGEPLSQLSPGGRGLVLLSLFLLSESADTRPLIIDQPEENLDPRTIFSDLIPNFRRASEMRQIIIVTHNANLVVNADSDQVIVADAKRSDPKSLPQFSYTAGGIEDAHIRDNICKILEGGPDAFLMRSNRYALTTSRKDTT